MKFLRYALPVIVMNLLIPAGAQSPSNQAFDQLKSLAGKWEGTTTTVPVTPAIEGSHVQITMRVTSSGHAILHEIKTEGRPDDPVTMLYLNGDHLYLTQYADFGNRPRMEADSMLHGNTLEFSEVDVSGPTQWGYMEHATFTIINSNHHVEDWTFLAPGNHALRVHFDLHRVP